MGGIAVAEVEWSLFFGSIFTAYGPTTVLFFMVVSQRAQLVILSLASAFTWLVSILIVATLWQIIPPLQDSIWATVPLSVVVQSIARVGIFYGYSKGELLIAKVATSPSAFPLNDPTSALSAGVGFGLMSSLMLYGGVVASSLNGRGAVFSESCTSVPLLFVSGMRRYPILVFGNWNKIFK